MTFVQIARKRLMRSQRVKYPGGAREGLWLVCGSFDCFLSDSKIDRAGAGMISTSCTSEKNLDFCARTQRFDEGARVREVVRSIDAIDLFLASCRSNHRFTSTSFNYLTESWFKKTEASCKAQHTNRLTRIFIRTLTCHRNVLPGP
jgi:hypothetical protein